MKEFLRKVFPFAITIADTAGGPVAGDALRALGNALGIKKNDTDTPPTFDELGAAYIGATPEQRAAALSEEHRYQETMKQLSITETTQIQALYNADLSNARAREIAVKDRTPEIGFYILVVLFGLTILALFKWPIPEHNAGTVFGAIGSLATLAIMAATYFYGTTRSSRNKDAVIGAAMAAASNGNGNGKH